jgi:hypothetical protein
MNVDDNEQNADRCLCPGCPTYNDCMRGESQRLFCSRGKTDCDPSANGCLCGGCPVWSDYDLSGYYYCKEGAAV